MSRRQKRRKKRKTFQRGFYFIFLLTIFIVCSCCFSKIDMVSSVKFSDVTKNLPFAKKLNTNDTSKQEDIEQENNEQEAVEQEDIKQEEIVFEDSENGEYSAENEKAVLDKYNNKIPVPYHYNASEFEGRLSQLIDNTDDKELKNKLQRIYDERESYPEIYLLSICNMPDMADFLIGYLHEDERPNKTAVLTDREKEKDCPLFLQWDRRWAYTDYGAPGDCIGTVGCAPTSLSMVSYKLTKNPDVTPVTVANYSMEHNFYQANSGGTSWTLFTSYANEMGVNVVQKNSSNISKDYILNELSNDHPIICSMKAGNFTTMGHIIVLAGTKDGKIIINDPNSKIRSSVLWDYDDISSQIRNCWIYSK